MRLAVNTRFIRFIYAIVLLIGVPLGVAGLWELFSIFVPTISPVIFIVVSQVFVVLFGIALFSGRSKLYQSRAEANALVASREQFLLLYERSPVPYVTLDQVGRIVMYNLAAVRLFQATTSNLIGQNLTVRITHEDLNYLSVVLGKIDSGLTIADEEVQIQTISGEYRWVLLSVFVYKEAEQRLVSLVDITHQKIVDIAKSEFVSLATHQLRTPVAAIRWNFELLLRTFQGNQSPDQNKFITKIERNILRMNALINDFLSVSKLETGTYATSLSRIDLAEFFGGIIDEYAQTISEKQLQLQRVFDPVVVSFTSDSRLLHIIVSNLLSNAVKYIPPKGGITISYQLQGKRLVISITDTGIGIPSSEQSQLFTKFFRARNAQAFRAEGTGLGLYIVKQSVEKLNGTITVNSTENVGTTFSMSLPYEP